MVRTSVVTPSYARHRGTVQSNLASEYNHQYVTHFEACSCDADTNLVQARASRPFTGRGLTCGLLFRGVVLAGRLSASDDRLGPGKPPSAGLVLPEHRG